MKLARILTIVLIFWTYIIAVNGDSSDEVDEANWYSIEGRVTGPDKKTSSDYFVGAQILVNGGEHIGVLREDGTFIVRGISPGSHVVEVLHSKFHYESTRVDITSKGKTRARRVNNLQPSHVSHVTYPLRFTPLGPYRYFQPREQWRITEILLSPMVLMMIIPLVLVIILPKMMSDPETRRELEQVSIPKYPEMPEMSEMLTSFFGGGSSSKAKEDSSERKKAIKAKKTT